MGKGDRKTAKGKRYSSSYGNARPKAVAKATGSAAAPVAKAAKAATRAPARKAVTPQRETKGGGDSPSVRARTAPPKRRGLLDRIEDWLRH